MEWLPIHRDRRQESLFGSLDNTLKQWDVATGRCHREWVLVGKEWVYLRENRTLLDHSPDAWSIAHGVGRDPETRKRRPLSLEYLLEES